MQTLFVISASAFVIAALTWYIVWAFWLHPPEGWLGKAIVNVMPLPQNEQIRHAAWFRWLKIGTLLLALVSAGVFGLWLAEEPALKRQ